MLSELTLSNAAASWRLYERVDDVRRWQGKMLEATGFGAVQTRSRIVHEGEGFTLRGYAAASAGGPVVLLVPAPIKRAYIWDLLPGASAVAACVKGGLRPYLIEWDSPRPSFGLADYADRFILECVNALKAETGTARLVIAGHSLGGLFAAIFASLRPTLLDGLVLITSPLHFEFAREAGAIGPVVAELSRSKALLEADANLPGAFLSMASFVASPASFGRERWDDWVRSWVHTDALASHLRAERWTLDELPLAHQLVMDIAQQLYREDGFLRGSLRLSGRSASAQQVVTPLFVVADKRCALVPPGAVLPFYEAAASEDKRLLWYEGDVGVAIQHVGPLIGRNAHRKLWPQILTWVHEHSR